MYWFLYKNRRPSYWTSNNWSVVNGRFFCPYAYIYLSSLERPKRQGLYAYQGKYTENARLSKEEKNLRIEFLQIFYDFKCHLFSSEFLFELI